MKQQCASYTAASCMTLCGLINADLQKSLPPRFIKFMWPMFDRGQNMSICVLWQESEDKR